MHDEHGNGEMAQDFAGRYRRMLGHGGGAVYRAVADLDDTVVVQLNAFARSWAPAARMVSLLAARLAAAEVILMIILAGIGRRRAAIEMLTSVALIYLVCEALGRLWPRRRPFERLPDVRSIAAHDPGRSFPSRHVASGLVMAAIGGEEHHALGALMAALAWLLGLSRIVAGLHYPSDVLAGAALAMATATVRRTLRMQS